MLHLCVLSYVRVVRAPLCALRFLDAWVLLSILGNWLLFLHRLLELEMVQIFVSSMWKLLELMFLWRDLEQSMPRAIDLLDRSYARFEVFCSRECLLQLVRSAWGPWLSLVQVDCQVKPIFCILDKCWWHQVLNLWLSVANWHFWRSLPLMLD